MKKTKTYWKRFARRNARYRENSKDRNKVFTSCRYNYKNPQRREYVIFDDKSGQYASNSWYAGMTNISKTFKLEYAKKFDSSGSIITLINQLKHTGAWRTIRVK